MCESVRDEMSLDVDPARVAAVIRSWNTAGEMEVDERLRAHLPADIGAMVDAALAGYGRHARAYLVAQDGHHWCVEVRARRSR